jgi:hypothetical protein
MKDKRFLKRTLGCAFAICLLAAVTTPAALASYYSSFEWQINGQSMAKQGIYAETTAASGELVLAGTALGSPFKASCPTSSAVGAIQQGGTASETIELNGCAMVEPSNCTISSSLPLNGINSKQFTEFGAPMFEKQTGGGIVDSLKISKCAIAGTFPINGTLTGLGQTENWQLENQPLTFSGGIDEYVGTGLTVGGLPATLTGTLSRHLTGSHAGAGWGYLLQPNYEWQTGSSTMKELSRSEEVTRGTGSGFVLTSQILGSKFKATCSSATSAGRIMLQGKEEEEERHISAVATGAKEAGHAASLPRMLSKI